MLWHKPDKQIQSLSVFIPAPPPRKTPYRERKIDQITEIIGEHGGIIYKIDSKILQGATEGLWLTYFFYLNQPQYKKLSSEIDTLLDSPFEYENEKENKIEGLYYD